MSELLYHWVAEYTDGTKLSQIENGVENKYTDIDRSRLSRFVLYAGDNPAFIVHLDGNKRLVYRLRRSLTVNGDIVENIHIVGYQELVNGRNVQSLAFVFETGRVELLDGFRPDTRWFYPVNFLPEESL